jgi:hypothetical protein
MIGHTVLLASVIPLFPAIMEEKTQEVGSSVSLAQRFAAGIRTVPSPAEEATGVQHVSPSKRAQTSLTHWDTETGGLGSSSVARDWWGEDAVSFPSYDLLVIVPTHGKSDLVKRQAIRDSWAQYLNRSAAPNCSNCRNKTTKILFVVGTEGGLTDMKKEADEFKDVGILENFGQEQYGFKSAEKTQLSIRYAVEHFKFRLLLKVDSDSWVFMDRLLAILDREHLWGTENGTALGIYGGHFYGGQDKSAASTSDAVSDGQDKSAASTSDAVSDGQNKSAALTSDAVSDAVMALTGTHSLPPHAAGAGYLLSPDLCEYIADMGAPSELVRDGDKHRKRDGFWAPYPRLATLPDEGTAVGFWLMAVNHTKVSLPVSSAKMDCDSTIIDHPVTTDEMLRRWRSYTELGNPCTLQVGAPDRQKAQEKVTQWLRRHLAMPRAVARAAVHRNWQHKVKNKAKKT